MAEVNPSPYPDNYSRSGFAGAHTAHIRADPSCDGTAQTPQSNKEGNLSDINTLETLSQNFHYSTVK